ncbi:hypothetical protein AX17_001200 [Amanita inopinata Kibby_2008]|nr:hypothetical protein AX17_001200 [Amanita inopinata Kibby_2008]
MSPAVHLDKKKGATRTKSLASSQRTLLDLFPSKRSANGTNSLPEALGSNAPSSPITINSDSELVVSHTDGAYEAVSQESHPSDIPPDSPMLASTLPSTPGSIDIVDDEEILPHTQSSGSSRDLVVKTPARGSTKHDPILIDPSPLKLNVQCSPKKCWSIFAPRDAEPVDHKKRRSRFNPIVPFPDLHTQHIRGPQTTFRAPESIFPRRHPFKHNVASLDCSVPEMQSFLDESDSCSPWKAKMIPCRSRDEHAKYLDTIPEEHRISHPAIRRLLPGASEHRYLDHTLWVDKWRPRNATEVLGNEASALYLRNWIYASALELGEFSAFGADLNDKIEKHMSMIKKVRGVKRPPVMRSVERRRGRKKRRIDSDDEGDGWIAYDDESDDGPFSRNVEGNDLHASQHIFQQLTNTIILTGPPGSGKTASVYACAEELGWDVFEVYPGVGKRNGASIDQLIGNVGKNHLIGKAALARDVHPFLHSRPQKDVGKFQDGPEQKHDNSQYEDQSIVEKYDLSKTTRSENAAVALRQSLVLLEEVDILFKDDINFWPTLVDFIKDCKRPVICTCNDISLIPMTDLPVQSILRFEACPSPIAASYLQGLCSVEGWLVDREALLQLCEMPNGSPAFGYDQSQFADVSVSPVADLRRAIHCLQLSCSTSQGTKDSDKESYVGSCCEADESGTGIASWSQNKDAALDGDAELSHVFRRVGKEAELMSFLDGIETRHEFILPEESEPSADDEVGHIILFPTKGMKAEFWKDYGDRSVLISSTAIRLARGGLEAGTTRGPTSTVRNNSFSTHALFRARVDYQSQIGNSLQRLVPCSELAMTRAAVYLDYAPYIRQMIAAEDEEEVRWKAQREGMAGGRKTRNSNRFERMIQVSEEERRGLQWEDA